MNTNGNHPLRLAVGSHAAGSGKGCAMNVISWESGDSTISDLPACADPLLARVVQDVNDSHCSHRDGDLLCAPCSVEVLALAHRTSGTALVGWSEADRHKVYVRLALDEAESLARPGEDERITECRVAVARWLQGAATLTEVRSARSRAGGDAARSARLAALIALIAATEAAAPTVAVTAVTAFNAAAGSDSRITRAHKLIDRFESLTGVRATPVPADTTALAYAAMTA